MKRTTKIWLGVGAYLLAGANPEALVAPGGPDLPLLMSAAWAQKKAGGEGGEGGEGGGVPSSYKLGSTDPSAFQFDARAQVGAYAALVHAAYEASHAEAVKLKAAIDGLLRNPNSGNLAKARFAWINARTPYLQTEAFRFYDGPIDFADYARQEEGPEGHLNSWPLNEAFIDYVKGNPNAGIINNPRIRITRESILERDQVSDEKDVTTGWHAIEFLLWGQDLSAAGPGNRPVGDYIPGRIANDRRRLYLRTVTEMLVADLAGLVEAWAPGRSDNYAATFLALDQREALGRMLSGMATLTGFELVSERLSVPLDSGDQEDEHSCFSDTTRNDFIYNVRGVRNVWFGDFGGLDGAGLDELTASRNPALAKRVTALLNRAEAAVDALPQPFDQILATPKESPERAIAEAAVKALQELAAALGDVGEALGVLVIVPAAGKP